MGEYSSRDILVLYGKSTQRRPDDSTGEDVGKIMMAHAGRRSYSRVNYPVFPCWDSVSAVDLPNVRGVAAAGSM